MRKPLLMEIVLPVVTTIAGLQLREHLPQRNQQTQDCLVKSAVPLTENELAQTQQPKFTRAQIIKRVKEIIIEKLGVDSTEVTLEASFTNDLGADSLDTVELLMSFEKEYHITIPDIKAEKLTTVRQVVDYLEKRLKPHRKQHS